ncbi:MAG: hypothetical protein HY077_16280 [Elusimicrobia bacterium]|nr:hypothetical protein [Elusimicrobiota bacterium]
MRALVLILALTPARAQEEASFRKAFYRECVSALGQLDSTKEHLSFVLKHGIDLQISTSTAKIPAQAVGLYRDADKKMYINEDILDKGRRELYYRSVEDAEVPKILAWKLLPTLGHEIRHAITHEKIRRQLGFSFDMPSLEDEMISFVDTVRVLEEAIQKNPDFWLGRLSLRIDGSDSALLGAWKKNPTALKQLVEPLYPITPSVLDLTHAEFLARVDASVKERRETRAMVVKAQKLITELKDPAARAREQRLLDDSEADQTSRVDLERFERLRGVMGDPANYAKLKKFFKSQIQALIRKTAPVPQ